LIPENFGNGWHFSTAPTGYAPGGNLIVIAGYKPAQELVNEKRSSAHRYINSN